MGRAMHGTEIKPINYPQYTASTMTQSVNFEADSDQTIAPANQAQIDADRYSDIKYEESEIPPSIYFGGCAFGAGFYVGVYMGMFERWGPDFYKKVLWSGGSAGAIFAVGLALGKTPEYMNCLYKTVAERAQRHGAFFYGSLFMEESVRELVSEPQCFKRLEGRCCIGTTAFFDRHRWHVSWEDNEDLVHTIKSSCHIPFYCQSNAGMRHGAVVDGAYGFRGTDLPHGDRTLYIGIDPHAEITRELSNDEMMYPSTGKEHEEMVHSGYLAFKAWDGRMLKKVGRRQPNCHALYVLWTLKACEIAYLALVWLLQWKVRLLLKGVLYVHGLVYGLPMERRKGLDTV